MIRSDWLESHQLRHVLDLLRHCSAVTFSSVLTKGKEPEDNFFLSTYQAKYMLPPVIRSGVRLTAVAFISIQLPCRRPRELSRCLCKGPLHFLQ